MAETQSNPLILQIVQHLKPGGIEMLALEMLRVSDVPMRIISLEGNYKDAVAHWPLLEQYQESLVFLDKPKGLSLRTVRRLVKYCRTHNPIGVHTHHIGPLLYGGLAARVANIKNLVHTEHDTWHLQRIKSRIMQRVLLALLRPALIADSARVADDLSRYFPSVPNHIILNGIDTERFVAGDIKAARILLGLPEDVPIIGCAARLETVKNHHLLLDAMESLPDTTHLALAGSGSLEQELKDYAQAKGLEKRVHFLGNINEMVAFYQSLNVFCLASHNEGLPLSLLEAQSCNVAVVATNVGGVSEAVAPDSGALVQAGDAKALAQSLQDALAHHDATPRDFILSHFSLSEMQADYQARLTC